MSEFRSGNKGRSHPYPTTPRFSAASGAGPFAENFAIGPGSDVNAAPGGTEIPWTALAVGAPGTSVPITPLSSGNVIITTTIDLHNTGVAAHDVLVQVLVDGVPIAPLAMTVSVPSASFGIAAIVTRIVLPVDGNDHDVGVLVTGDATDINIVSGNSTIEIHEAPTATG